MARIYKEGQGKWSRGILVAVLLIASIYALAELHGAMPRGSRIEIPIIGFDLDWRFLVHGPLLLLAAWIAFWLFNRPPTADFLIDTENELKNKVTWPSQKEEVNSSVVVVVTVMILGALIFAVDALFSVVFDKGFYTFGG